jgi:hypothetical protein
MTSVEHLNRKQLLAEIAKRDTDNVRLHCEKARLEQLLRLMEQKVEGLVRRFFGASGRSSIPASCSCCCSSCPARGF